MKLVFFGSSQFSVYVLEKLKAESLLPYLIVTTPDKPKGRKLILSPNATKEWAIKNNVDFLEFKSLKDPSKNVDGKSAETELSKTSPDLFLVASYGRIIPANIFNIPKFKTLNIHPSLLPKWRGASPIVAQILNDDGNPDTGEGLGISIMQIDEGMDTGGVLIQKQIATSPLFPPLDKGREPEGGVIYWPSNREELEKILAEEGAEMFIEVAPKWLKGEIEAKKQDDSKATICGKIEKEDGLIDLNDDPYKNLLKIKAYQGWPTAYFFFERRSDGSGGSNKIRVIITDATIENNLLKILKVIPEGKRVMPYEDFLRGNRTA